MPRLLLILMVACPWSLVAAEPTREQLDFVEKRVRPVIVESCQECHGPRKQNAKLRLDSRAAMLKGGDSGPAIIPGDPDNSLLIAAVRHQNELKMPPMKYKLADNVVADLVEWVRMGAPWQDAPVVRVAEPKRHWAFQSIGKPPLPGIQRRDWPQTTIDSYILAQLEAKSLSPSPPADKRTLLRRVTFDLTGLPPTSLETEAFLADQSKDAFGRVVERLLASPAYGERWARYWLDVARFADTKGYVFFQDANYPWAHTYRDYVIRAFNDDVPYDRFVLEQLAADQLGGDRRSLTALGFLTLGGRFMNNVHDIIDDQIDVVTRGLMGLTVTCARCHDHKYDPTTQLDYYALYGVFASCVEPEVPPLFEDPPKTPTYESFRKEMETREKKLTDYIDSQFQQVVAGSRTRAAEYWLAVHAQGSQPTQDDFMLLADGPDINPTMVKRWRAQLDRAKRRHDPALAPWLALTALPETGFAAKAKELCTSWLAAPDPQRPLNAHVVLALNARPPATLAEAAKRYGELLNDVDRVWRDALRANPKLTKLPDSDLEQLRLVFHGPGAAPNLARGMIEELALFPDRPSQAKLQELRKAVEQHRISGTGAPPRAHALIDRPEPVEPRVFLRGNPNQPGAAVPRRAPEFLSSKLFQIGSGRLELAQMIVDPRNPLTARVIVNRVWQQHFGHGLVRTPADFGVRSDPPTHPELLDHLASTLMQDGWSLKNLHRRIVHSAAYQQRSDYRPDLAAVDPENRLIARMNRRRLDFESTRDSMLAVGGRLDRRLGGPSSRDILDSRSTRRTLYGFVDRLQVPGLFRSFDFPSPDAMSARRDATTIPQQALYLMNSPFAMEIARSVLRRADIRNSTSNEARIRQLYVVALGREPSRPEIDLALQFLGPCSPVDWERFAHALLATNEFVFID